MQSFISETLEDVLKHTQSFKNLSVVLPSQRAGVFVKQKLKDSIKGGFLPQIITIEQFVEHVSEIKKIDTIHLLFDFYTVYKKFEKQQVDTFDVFSSWAFTVLQDFNEIDQHLINTTELFSYLKDIQRLKKWSAKNPVKETKLIKDHFHFIEKLNEYYNVLYKFLIEKNIGYQGLIYREATKKIDAFLLKNREKKIIFIGFNALNRAEELLFQKILSTGNSEIYWDIDAYFLKTNHQAGKFIRTYHKQWKYYQKNPLKTIGNAFLKQKNIQIIGAPKNNTQIKYVGNILQKLSNHQNTALVLADQTLLPIALNSLSTKVTSVNITMGYPLKNIPIAHFIFSIFQLFLSQVKLQKIKDNVFYYKDVIRFFRHPSIQKCMFKNMVSSPSSSRNITKYLINQNNIFVSQKEILSFLENLETSLQNTIGAVFNPFKTISDFLDRILNLIFILKRGADKLEKEYLFRFYTLFTQLQNLHLEYHYFENLRTVHQFFKHLITLDHLSFQGEPLQGLQIMGMLETRVLDFENVIITSVNEGVLPNNNTQISFIPFDIKLEYNLPTYAEKDAIFSYHFFRLIQRAKNIFILYNTEQDSFGNGEKSRFVTQLQMIKKEIFEKNISPKVYTEKSNLKEIFKNEFVLKKLKELAEKGISPSAITNYLYNPISFYKQKILGIHEFKTIEEIISVNTMGTLIHSVLEALYKSFVGKFIVFKDLVKMQKEYAYLAEECFTKYFKNGNISTGKNRLIFEVVNQFIYNFLEQEKNLLKDGNNKLKIIAIEQEFSSEIIIDELDFPIKIKGIVDRIDQLNGVVRIIDYKIGMVRDSDLRILDFKLIKHYKYHKVIQVMLYAFLFVNNTHFNFEKPLEAGIICFKNLKKGLLKINFSSNYRNQNNAILPEKLNEFIEEFKSILLEIYDIKTPFKESLNL